MIPSFSQVRSKQKFAGEPLQFLEPRRLLSFSSAVTYNIGTQSDSFVPNAAPINVVTGDFNGDGKLDLVVAHKIESSVYFLAGKGDGTFQPAVQISIGEAIEGREFAGDFNNDGKLDLFLPGDITTANHPIILLGNGNGTFQPRIDSSSFAVPNTYPRGWCVGDFTGDGKLDVASTLPSGADTGGYIVLPGNGDGTFRAGIVGPLTTLHYSRWSVAADINGDGKLDMAVADGQGQGDNTGTAELTILLGNGDGTFHLAGHYPSPQTESDENVVVNPEDVALGDVNHDGKLDAIESDYDHNINVFLGNGDGTFQPAMGIGDLEYPRDVAFTDVNADGLIDLVVDNLGVGPGGSAYAQEGTVPGSVSVLLGNGDGSFQSPIQYNSVFYPGWAAVADFNGDSLPDIAVTQVSNGHSVNVMINHPASDSPSIAAPASAAVNPLSVNSVPGSTDALSVLGAASAGESSLTYTWSVTSKPSGATTPTFNINGTNPAKNTTATFTQPGLYTFLVTLSNGQGTMSSSLQVTVATNQKPTVATAAKANPSPVLGSTTTLSVLGADDGGEDGLTYTWSSFGTPPAPVNFSINGTHDAKNTVATFSAWGTYQFLVTITDAGGLNTTTGVTVVVVFPTLVNGSSGNDTYVLRLNPNNNQLVQLFINTPTTGSPTYSANKSQTSSLNIVGQNGDDSLTIDFASGDPIPAGGMTFDGGANGTSNGDSLFIEGSAGADAFSIDPSHVTDTADSTVVGYANLEHVQFDLLGGDDSLTQIATPAAALAFNGGTGNDTLNVNAGSFTASADLGATTQNLIVNVAAPATAVFNASQHLAGLNISGSATISGAGNVLVTRSLTIPTGDLDMNANDLIVDYTGATQLDAIQSLINSARNGGSWTGSGITSSAAKNDAKHITTLGAMEATDYKSIYGSTAMFDGATVDNTAVLVKYTYYGDANFSGTVDGGDYARMDLTFAKEATQGNIGGWFNGDFDGDGRVNGSDYGLADLAFGSQGLPINAPPALAPAAHPPHIGGGVGLPLT